MSVEDFIADRLFHPGLSAVRGDWDKALGRVDTDPEGAITAARSMLESMCKHILDLVGEPYDNKIEFPKLYALVAKRLGIAASQQVDQSFRALFGAAHTVVQSVGELRNKFGDAHGKGQSALRASRAQSQLAVNLAGSMAAFLASALESHVVATRRLTPDGRAILKFEKTTVWRLADHARNAPKSQKTYGQRRPKPALWLVGDAGVYLMSNGSPQISSEGRVPRDGKATEIPYLTAPAEGCNPERDELDDWWPIHNALAEGSDFVHDIPLAVIETALDGCTNQIVLIGNEDGYDVLSDIEFGELEAGKSV